MLTMVVRLSQHYNNLRWGTLWAINWRWVNGVPLCPITL